MRKQLLWLDGKLVEATPALLESLTPGVLNAKGVFETMRATGGKVPLLAAHLKRMSRGLKVLHLPPTTYHLKIYQNILELLKLNRLKNARVRLMIWREGRILRRVIVTEPLKPPAARKYKEGFTAMLTNGHYRNTLEPIKSLDYQIFREGLRKARSAGFDEALFVNRKGELVEGSRTNIFLVKNNVLLTPPIASGCLPGVTRHRIIAAARRLKLRCAQRKLTAADLFSADEAFVTNALLGIMPLTGLGKQKISTGKPGEITAHLIRYMSPK